MDYTTIQNAATKIVDNLKTIDGNINALQNKQDIISTSDMSMANSHEGKLKIDKIGGKCEQVSTTGAQLFDVNSDFLNAIIVNGIVTDSANYRLYVIPVTAGNEYTLTKKVYEKSSYLGFYNEIPTFGSILTNRIDLTSLEEITFTASDNYLCLMMHNDDNISTIMLNVGTDPLPWEPYTGGQPSPNPDYPQEIKKTVVNAIKTHGKNFVNFNLESDTRNGVTFVSVYDENGKLEYIEANGTATDTAYISVKVTLLAGDYIVNGVNGGSYSTYNIYGLKMGEWRAIFKTLYNGDVSFTLSEKTDIACRCRVIAGYTANNVRFYPMIRKADVEDATYEPYTESVIALSEPIELYGIGDVQDTIEDGKVVRRFMSAVLKGNDDKVWNTNTNSRVYIRFKDIKIPTNNTDTNNVLCTHFSQVTKNVNYETFGTFAVEKNTGVLYFREESATSINSWKEWLADNEVIVVYELAEPVFEPLPLTDQAALHSLSTYNHITYVEFDSEIKPTFKGEYGVTKIGGRVLEDMMNGLNSELSAQSDAERITALESTIVNNVQD